jgi:hypothetical protein
VDLYERLNKPSAQLSARENFFQKKYTHADAYKIATSAYYICHIPHKNLQLSAQNPYNAEDFCCIIIETRL